MKKYFWIFSLITMLNLPCNTSATQWVKINEAEMGLLEIDTDSLQYTDIENPSRIFKGWSKLTLYKNLPEDGLKIGDHAKSLQHYDCLNKQIKLVSYISYNEKEVVESIQHENPKFQDVIPESSGEYVLNSICKIWKIKLNQYNISP